MKFQKSIVALVLALILALTLSIPVFAAETGAQDAPYLGGNNYGDADGASIQLHKLDIAGFERNKAAALIEDGTLAAGGTVSYTGNVPLGTALAGGDVVGTYTTSAAPDAKVDVTLKELAALGNITFRIEQVQLTNGKTPGSTSPDDYEAVASGIDGYAKTDSTGLISWTGLPYSYYRITEQANETGAPVGASSYIVSLPMVNPGDNSQTLNTVHIYPKNRASSGPVVEKDKPTVDDYNGNILSWTIKAEIPASLKADKGVQSYVITDTMSNGIQFAGNLSVYYLSGGNQVALTQGVDYSTPVANGDTSMVITLESAGFTKLGNALAGIDKDVTGRYILYVTYDTVVNISQADIEGNITPNNDVKLNFTNSDGTAYENDPDPVVVDKYAGIKLIKKDGANENVLLPNAKFKVYTALNNEGNAVDESSVLKDAAGAELEFTTDSNGQFIYTGLGAGSYHLVETTAPNGYKKLSGYTTITLEAADVEANSSREAVVLNYLDNGLTLPSTGGLGTLLFSIGGVVLVALGGVMFLLSRKRKSTNKQAR